MSDSATSDAWQKGWQVLQQQFAQAWRDSTGTGGPKAPLAEGFEMWAKLAGGGESGNEVLDRSVAAVRDWVGMMQSLVDSGAGRGGDWSKAFNQALGGFDLASNPVAEALRRAVGDGARGFEQLQAEFGRAAQPFGDAFKGLLHLPAFGYARESQERHQQLALALAAHQEQFDRYNRLMLDASRRALERLQSKLAEHAEPGRQLKSFRQLYDTWIDAAEEGYAEVALSDEFRHAYGALVNAQMRVRSLVQGEIERSTGAVGMPTRGELDGVHRKIAELKRRIAELEHALALGRAGAVDAPKAAADAPPPRRKAAARPARKTPALRVVAGTAAGDAPMARGPSAPRTKVAGKVAKAVASTPERRPAGSGGAAKSRSAASAGKAAQPAGKTRTAASTAGSFADRLAASRQSSRTPRKGGR
jgi:class III poly(R)-hydroxyalkanoic acid synthase PhaE subunit